MLHDDLLTPSRNHRQQVYTIEVTNVVTQFKLDAPLPTGSGCHLIKLKPGHYAIDFVVIDRLIGGRSAEKISYSVFCNGISAT